jgi:hypothetical protein
LAALFSPKSRLKFIMESYWDLYIAYIDHCVRYNYENDIDPHHYEMEWNHFLPQCIFGDQPIGQYLLLRQHAIASALQSLAFNYNCMTGGHKKFLPDELLALAWPIFRQSQTGKNNPMYGRSVTWTDERKQRHSDLMSGEGNPMYGKTGELNPTFGKKRPVMSKRMSGENNPMYGKKRPELSKNMLGENNHSYGKKWWVNAQGQTLLQTESPGPEWQRGMKWKNIKEESPCAE